MGNRLYDNEFEEFLKNQANQHRMYPSDQVWRKIQGEVHGYRKWPALTIIAVFIIAALVVGTVAVKPHSEFIVQQKTQSTGNEQSKDQATATTITESEKSYADHLTVNNITRQTIAKVTETIQEKEAEELLIVPSTEFSANHLANINIPEKTSVNAPVQIQDNKDENSIADNTSATTLHNTSLPDARFIFSNNFSVPNSSGYYFTSAVYNDEFSYVRNASSSQVNIDLGATRPTSSPSLLNIGKRSSKLDFQFFVTPSISYRRLVDDVQGSLSKSYVTALPYASNYIVDLNHVIQHRPAAGYEIGFSLGYNTGRKFAIRTGLQFNTRQYNIDAFVHSAEPATVALSADNSNLVFNTISGFRNIDGSSPIKLKNRYYEIAVPIGIDWRPVNKKFAWGIATAIQPTYTFDKEPFIITSNYKNYADGSQLMRNWNINVNFETYLGYNTGKYRWQIGPQLRYQLMPTMANSFPIREYPVDFGIKLGLTRALR
ncbi:PorT family protein [Panacibacter ginsenosidivorans]|uniref:PorT family protein n=1 Tax=Panacibacter ginsenosidivorans TaxID=1813871 RepID=A0A5B8V844_9BACT|nr:outer membrane beta-barrel protein [Panacibacter ginsenosidivorans]QEC67512.1 PorT family protein [Panacibacter ginsenosidivorans]